jgi:hypothetical protein
MKKKGEGLRLNEGKTRHDLIPAFAQEQYAQVLTKGSKKYAERNWESGMEWSKVLASMKRHILAFEKGEDFDPETGLHHTAHIMCNAAFLTEYYKIYPQGDNRPHTYLDMPKIGLDIDEVICNWVGPWIKKWGIKDIPTSWYFDRKIQERFESMRNKGTLDKFYLGLPTLINGEDLPFEPHCYITSRPVPTEVTEAWLDKHGFPAKPVITVGIGGSKVEAAKEAGVEIFVDDSFSNFKALNQEGICCYLFNAPHNERYDVGHKRIHSLDELMY